MYADRITDSMKRAIDETKRRRTIQEAYNKKHHIIPKTVSKEVVSLIESTKVAETTPSYDKTSLSPSDMKNLIHTLEKQMQEAAKRMEFEQAAALRDRISVLQKQSTLQIYDDTLPSALAGKDMPKRRYRRKVSRPDQHKRR